jgi:hypothetical protein
MSRMKTITELCDDLVAVYEAKGQAVSHNLKPGIAESEFAQSMGRDRTAIPTAVLELYQWHNGCIDETADSLFCFRDCCFISADRAQAELNLIQSVYGTEMEERFDLTQVIPIATFEGAVLAVVIGPHSLGDSCEHPVVSIFEGIDLWFCSLTSMLQTCIAWVSHPDWAPFEALPSNEELAIWRRLNPGVDLG